MPEANPTAPRNSGGALSKTLAGLSILVVDDIETNRSVARLFLERAGATVTLAEDGAGGIKACRSHRFDIVLMDVQMPGINGIEATRRLRASGFEPPILALTAFSSGGDRDSCLEAGMNDFLGKPFEPSVLMQTISRWCNAERDPATKHRESAIEDEDLRELALDWLRTLPTRLADAANAITAQDYEALGRIAHAIKGTGGSLGLPSFTSLAAELESAVHRRDLQGARLRLVALKREHTAITTRLAA
jgi:hypothetical protein